MRAPLPECFCEWQLPDELFAKAAEAGHAIGDKRFLNGNGTKHLREAWAIGRAGVLLGATRARLSRDDPPDGHLDLSGIGVTPVEVTERLQEGRRRGDEVPSGMRLQLQDELNSAIEQNKAWVETLIRKKLANDARFPPKTVLLVYHNTSLYNFDPERTRAEFEAASALHGNNIVGSIILYEGEVYGRSTLARL